MRNIILILVVVVTLSACSAGSFRFGRSSDGKGVKLSEIRKDIDRVETRNVYISKKKLQNSIADPNQLNKIRLVKTFFRSSSFAPSLPTYRVFDLADDGPYQLLGLRNADILVGVNDWVLFNPQKFKQYIYLLQNEEAAQIEIKRKGKGIVFKYNFIE